MQPKPAPFGKRGAPVNRPAAGRSLAAALPATELSSTGVPLSEIAKTLMAKGPDEKIETRTSETGIVPTSWRAGILAGVAASSLQAGWVILSATSGADQTTAMLQAAGVDQTKALPILLAGSLLAGGEATASTILFAHSLLKKSGHNNAIAYAVGGGLAAGVLSYVSDAIGMSIGASNLSVDIATGVAAGFFYRMFAGLRG